MTVKSGSSEGRASDEPIQLLDQRRSVEEFASVLVNEHAPSLRKYVARLLPGDVHRSEDIVQETLLRAWQNRGILIAQASTRPWLFRVARNLSVDWYRRQASRPSEVPADYAVDVHDDLALDRLENVLRRRLVGELLNRLSSQHREVLVQLYYFGLSQAEVADLLGIAQGTVKSRAHYALAEIRRTSKIH